MKKSISRFLKFLFLSGIFYLFALNALFAQQYYQDVIYLKDSTVVKGIIIEQVPNQTYKIKTADNKVFLFKIGEIEKITKEEIPYNKLYRQSDTIFSKFWTSIEPGLIFGLGDKELESVHFKNNGQYFSGFIVNSFMLSNRLSMGLGVGFETYSYGTNIPFFLDFRKYFGNGKVIPMLIIDGGYAFGWVRNNQGSDWGGLLLDTSFGLVIRRAFSRDIFVRIGYKLQEFKVDVNFNHTKIKAGFISVRIGIII